MKRLLIGFDVDGTLINDDDSPREDIVELLRILNNYADIIVWSGGGQDYARTIGTRLSLPEEVIYLGKGNAIRPDIAFDDSEFFNLADKVITV